MERTALPGDDRVADPQVRVLGNVLELDAARGSVRERPPASALDDGRQLLVTSVIKRTLLESGLTSMMRPTAPSSAMTPSSRATWASDPLSICTMRRAFSGSYPTTVAGMPAGTRSWRSRAAKRSGAWETPRPAQRCSASTARSRSPSGRSADRATGSRRATRIRRGRRRSRRTRSAPGRRLLRKGRPRGDLVRPSRANSTWMSASSAATMTAPITANSFLSSRYVKIDTTS